MRNFNNKNGIDLICRAHQVVEDGYEFFCQRKLVTLFSAPNYCGDFDNSGAMMSINEDLMCNFEILIPKPKDKKNDSDSEELNDIRTNFKQNMSEQA